MATNQEVLGPKPRTGEGLQTSLPQLEKHWDHTLLTSAYTAAVGGNGFCLNPKRDAFHPDAKLFPGAWNGQTPHQLRQAIRPEWSHASEFWSDQRAHTSHSQRPLGKDGGSMGRYGWGAERCGCWAFELWNLPSSSVHKSMRSIYIYYIILYYRRSAKGRKVAKHCVFSNDLRLRRVEKVGSLKRRVRSQLARWEMKNCTPLWREAHFQVKMHKTPQRRTTFGSWDVEKVHAVVARSTFRSQNVQNTPLSDHFWKLRCRKSARRCGAKHISKSKCTKHTMYGPFLEVQMSKKCTPLWREAHFQVKMHKTRHVRTIFGGSEVVSRFTLHSNTLHYTTTTLHEILLHYTPLHYTALNYIQLHYITLHSTTLHYITLHYITLNDTAPQIDR